MNCFKFHTDTTLDNFDHLYEQEETIDDNEELPQAVDERCCRKFEKYMENLETYQVDGQSIEKSKKRKVGSKKLIFAVSAPFLS